MVDPCAPARSRSVYVDVLDEEMVVPRHIRRLNGQRNQGWQVIFEAPSRYFGDAQYGGPQRALAAAKRHLRSIWRPMEWSTSRGLHPRTRKPTSGVRVMKREGSSGRVTWYVEASHPVRGMAPKRYRIGPKRNRVAIAAAKEKALEQRREWLREHPKPIR